MPARRPSVLQRSIARADAFVRLRRLSRAHPTVAAAIHQVRKDKLTYLPLESLVDLAEAVGAIERAGLPGQIVEAGTALGGSAIVLAAAKAVTRPMTLYDTFGMIPPPTDKDGTEVHRRYEEIASGRAKGIGGDRYYGYRDDGVADVTRAFERHGFACGANNVELVAGLFDETLHPTGPVALAHVDCDWYDSVRVCLREIGPQLVPGGRFVIDDYDFWSGCTRAVDEFLSDAGDEFRVVRASRLQLIRS
jgi:hypothetical protein